MPKAKSRKKIEGAIIRVKETLTNTCLEDFLGNKKTREEVVDIYLNIVNKDFLKSFKVFPDKSFLFYGPPGNGKTFAIKCLAGEIGKNKGQIYVVVPYEIGKYGTAYINLGAVKMNTFFETGKELSQKENVKGVIYLFDECDVIMGKRENFSSHKEDNKVLEILMKHLQRIHDEDTNEYIFFTTNLKEEIDLASIRSGRMDKTVVFENPDKNARFELFKKEIERINENAGYDVIYKYNLDHLVEESSEFNCCDCIEIPKRALKNTLLKIMKRRSRNMVFPVYLTNKNLLEEIKRQKERNSKIKKMGFLV